MNEEKPILSVHMITYNHEFFVKKAIESVLMQKCDFEIEFIISNDNSIDNTDIKIKEVLDTHPKAHSIKYFRHVSNKGLISNFIWTIEQCKGKYIALCEGDDYWTDPYKLQKQVDLLEKYPEASMCVALMEAHYENENKIARDLPYEGKNFPLIYLDDLNQYFHTSTYLIRNSMLTDVLDKYPDLMMGDTALRYLLLSKGPFVVLNDVVSVYRISGLGAWSKLSQHNKNLEACKTANAFRKKFIKEQRGTHLTNEFNALRDIIGYFIKKKSFVKSFSYSFKYILLLIKYHPKKEFKEIMIRLKK